MSSAIFSDVACLDLRRNSTSQFGSQESPSVGTKFMPFTVAAAELTEHCSTLKSLLSDWTATQAEQRNSIRDLLRLVQGIKVSVHVNYKEDVCSIALPHQTAESCCHEALECQRQSRLNSSNVKFNEAVRTTCPQIYDMTQLDHDDDDLETMYAELVAPWCRGNAIDVLHKSSEGHSLELTNGEDSPRMNSLISDGTQMPLQQLNALERLQAFKYEASALVASSLDLFQIEKGCEKECVLLEDGESNCECIADVSQISTALDSEACEPPSDLMDNSHLVANGSILDTRPGSPISPSFRHETLVLGACAKEELSCSTEAVALAPQTPPLSTFGCSIRDAAIAYLEETKLAKLPLHASGSRLAQSSTPTIAELASRLEMRRSIIEESIAEARVAQEETSPRPRAGSIPPKDDNSQYNCRWGACSQELAEKLDKRWHMSEHHTPQ